MCHDSFFINCSKNTIFITVLNEFKCIITFFCSVHTITLFGY